METLGFFVLVGFILWAIYAQAYKDGKREGSRKGYGVGFDRGKRSKSQAGCLVAVLTLGVLWTLTGGLAVGCSCSRSSSEATATNKSDLAIRDERKLDATSIPHAQHDTKPTTAVSANFLKKAGYAPNRCLICFESRSLISQEKYSDMSGYGLCDRCGHGVELTKAGITIQENGAVLPPELIRQTREFSLVLQQSLTQKPDDFHRVLIMLILTQFRSQDWEDFTNGR